MEDDFEDLYNMDTQNQVVVHMCVQMMFRDVIISEESRI